MWILRASTQSSQAEVQVMKPTEDVYRDDPVASSPSRSRDILDLLSEVLEESVEVAIGQEKIP